MVRCLPRFAGFTSQTHKIRSFLCIFCFSYSHENFRPFDSFFILFLFFRVSVARKLFYQNFHFLPLYTRLTSYMHILLNMQITFSNLPMMLTLTLMLYSILSFEHVWPISILIELWIFQQNSFTKVFGCQNVETRVHTCRRNVMTNNFKPFLNSPPPHFNYAVVEK